MGEDREAPIDHRTYFGSPTVRWFTYNSGDVMARLLIDGQTGISDVTPTDLARLQATPNPFRRTVTIVSRGGSSQTLKIRDITGRCVRELWPMGLALLSAEENSACTQTQAVWDGHDQEGRRLPAGAYFIEARTGTERSVVQVLMAR
jgi:hypothetical protein